MTGLDTSTRMIQKSHCRKRAEAWSPLSEARSEASLGILWEGARLASGSGRRALHGRDDLWPDRFDFAFLILNKGLSFGDIPSKENSERQELHF